MRKPVIKRLFSLIMCLAMFFTVVPAAMAAETVSSINVSVPSPAEGMIPVQAEEVSEEGFFYFIAWTDETGQLAGGERFRAGQTVRCYILAFAREGYEFENGAVIRINGSPAEMVLATPGRLQGYVEYRIFPLNLIATVTAPVDGALPEWNADADSEAFTVEVAGWYKAEESGAPESPMDRTETFQTGQIYYVDLAFRPVAGYTFPEEAPEATIDTLKAEFRNRQEDGGLVYRVKFTLPVGAAAVTVTPPAAGASPSEKGSVSGKNVVLSGGVVWLAGDTRMGAPDVFEAGTDYTCSVTLVSQDGAELADNMTVTINGNRAAAGGTMNGERTFRYTFSVPDCKAPTIKTAEQVNNGIKITWDPVPGVVRYAIYRQNGSEYQKVSERSGTSYIDTSPDSGKSNGYAIRCMNSAGKYVSPIGTVKAIVYYGLKAPTLTKPERTDNGLKLSWTEVPGAAKYAVYRRVGENGQWQRHTVVAGVSYLDRSVENGIRYYYTVRCLDDAGAIQSEESSVQTKEYFRLAGPVMTGAEKENKTIRVSWNAVKGAAKYAVYRKTDKDGEWVRYAITASTSYVDRKVENGGWYGYTVRCMDNSNRIISDYESTRARSYYDLNGPTIRTAARVEGGIRLTWDSIRGAAKYAVYRKTDGESTWTRHSVTTNTAYTDRNVENGVEYSYMIRCLDAAGTLISPERSARSVTYYRLAAPVITSVLWTNLGVRVTWNRVAGASRYFVMRKHGSDPWEPYSYTNETFFLDPEVTAGETYTYTVMCIGDGIEVISDYNRHGASIVLK